MSVVERVLDTLMRFDSTATGAAQLAYKAHLRTYAVDRLREIIAIGGPEYNGLLKQLEAIRAFQTNEGLTLMDKSDDFQTHSYSFAGWADLMGQMSLHVSAAAQTPMVRLFGQSPAGFNSGDGDLRNYYDRIESRRNNDMTGPIKYIFEIMHYSLFGRPLPDGFSFEFDGLWQLSGIDKSTVMVNTTTAIRDAFNDGLLTKKQALTEIKQYANETGFGSSISDEDIENAEEHAPEPEEETEQSEKDITSSTEADRTEVRKSTTADSAASGKGNNNRLRWFGKLFK